MTSKLSERLKRIEQFKSKRLLASELPSKRVIVDPRLGQSADDVREDFPGQLVIVREIIWPSEENR